MPTFLSTFIEKRRMSARFKRLQRFDEARIAEIWMPTEQPAFRAMAHREG